MRHDFRVLLAFATALLLVLPARPGHAAESKQPANTASTLIITEENDYFAGTDNHYTNGIKLSWVSGDLKKYAEDERLPEFVLPYLRILPFVNEPGQQYNVALSLGQNMYVPQDTRSGIVQPDDRPFSGWGYISLALHAKTATQLDTFETSIGVVGPSALAEETQNNYHAIMGFERVRGWGRQLQDEPGIVLSWQRTLRAARLDLGHDMAWDLLPHVRATAGNVQTHAAAGFETRLGYRLPWDFGTSLIQPGGGVSAPAAPDDPRLRVDTDFGLHFFAGAEARAVARNIFLDGNTWENGPHVPKKALVADLMGGVGLVLGRAKLTYTHVYRTEEFYGQKGGQLFGSVSLSVTF
ncbi:MAG TPA: lipid A deacylase LpxR family protein [Humidesulfovibrio sp.]|uniref:lipid A deacylase LpxR family protein n=1 Tax=Humidesulfovibrio sp. TaxID=2910988 RepID=UPI002BF0D7E6|nr:lipid A deacylase LpxR family protein [Humidesulfovibrio sp.]HWR04027.1 lipid A deacylase LpxR family protein [Humidesulfovibrio sp.]